MKKYEMIGSSEEDRKMQEGLKRNQMETRKRNKIRAKKEKIENAVVRFVLVLITIGMTLGFAALLVLINMIENLSF